MMKSRLALSPTGPGSSLADRRRPDSSETLPAPRLALFQTVAPLFADDWTNSIRSPAWVNR